MLYCKGFIKPNFVIQVSSKMQIGELLQDGLPLLSMKQFIKI